MRELDIEHTKIEQSVNARKVPSGLGWLMEAERGGE